MDNLTMSPSTYPFQHWAPLGIVTDSLSHLGNLSNQAEALSTIDLRRCFVAGPYALELLVRKVEKVQAYIGCWPVSGTKLTVLNARPFLVGGQGRTPSERESSNFLDPNLGAAKAPTTWLPDAFERLQELMILDPNWDGEDGQAVTPEAASSTFALLSSLASRTTLEPSLVPTSEGRLQLEWHEPTAHLEAEVAADGSRVIIWYHDLLAGTEREETIQSMRVALREIDALLTVIESR